ncbi:MAG: ComEC/Rec2 family competence protein, partial [Desulfosarcinaceae bacterium]
MDIHRPLIPAAAGLMGGIVLGACLPGYFALAVAVAAALAAGLLACVLRRRGAGVMPLLFIAAAGYLSVQPWLAPHLPRNHVSRYADQGKWLIQGVVGGDPVCRSGRMRFVLDARHLTGKAGSFAVCGALQVTAALPGPDLRRGDRVSFSGHVRKVRNFSNPGGFDYERFMALRRIFVRTYADKSGLTLMAGDASPDGSGFFNGLRRSLSLRMDRALAGSSPDTLQLLKALTLGERKSLSEGLREQFARVGVGHLLAISGLHIGIVALCVYGGAVRLLVLWPWLLARGWIRRAASLAALAAVFLYGALAGLSPSTQRAMLMVAVCLAGWWVGRGHDWFNTLAVAAIILLVITPHALLNVSFQLSFAAVATILLGLNRNRSRISPQRNQGLGKALPARLATFARVTLLATLGTLPLIMRYFNQISLVGPLANLFAVPLAGSLAVPCGLSGCLLAGISPTLAGWLWQAAALALDGLLLVVQWASRWDYAAVNCVTPSWLELALFYAFLWLV